MDITKIFQDLSPQNIDPYPSSPKSSSSSYSSSVSSSSSSLESSIFPVSCSYLYDQMELVFHSKKKQRRNALTCYCRAPDEGNKMYSKVDQPWKVAKGRKYRGSQTYRVNQTYQIRIKI